MFKMEPEEDLIAELEQLKKEFGEDLPIRPVSAGSRPRSANNPAPARAHQDPCPHPGGPPASVAPRRGRMRYPKALRDLPRDSHPSPPAGRRSSSRHSRKCAVCNHPQRSEIEHRFLRWHSQAQIAEDFRLYDRLAVFRHAKATGLLHRRVHNLNAALEHILEQGSCIPITGSVVVDAVKKYAMLQNQWHEPPRQIIVHHVHETSSAAARSQDQSSGPPASGFKPPASNVRSLAPNRHTRRIENRRKPLKTKGRRSP